MILKICYIAKIEINRILPLDATGSAKYHFIVIIAFFIE